MFQRNDFFNAVTVYAPISGDITALNPSDAVCSELHDNQGLRCGNAEVVLDYIVYRPETGDSLGLNLSDAYG